MENELYIWYNRQFLKKKGFPLSDKITLFEKFEGKFINNSEWKALSFRDISFPPKEDKYKFPPNQFLVIKQKIKEVLFDYIEYRSNVKIVSDRFFKFLKESGLENNQYEVAELSIVDKIGKILTEERYYALRFGVFDDTLFDFNEQTKQRTNVHGSTNYLFPNLALKPLPIEKSVFVLEHISYREALIFKKTVLENTLTFQTPEIYRLKDYPYIYINQYNEELLPIKNQYQININNH